MMAKRKRKKKKNILANTGNVISIIAGIVVILFFLNMYYDWVEVELPFDFDKPNGGNSPLPPSDSTSSCSDTDSGRDLYTPAHIVLDDISYYDTCKDDTILTEFYCSGNAGVQEDVACPLGYECVATRSGGYCDIVTVTHQEGDYLGGGSGSGTTSDPIIINQIDLGDIVGGNCQLGATLSTSWDYANQECQGVMGSEGLIWTFSDSNSVEYQRIDSVPVGLGVDLGCGLDYDGTPWTMQIERIIPAQLPNCQLDYEWEVRVIACNCQ